jgi:lipoprotein-anchoring transpeptidase ErfK/SrfK
MGLSKPTYGIHGTNDPASIGRDMSHGCVRMDNEDILELSSAVPIGTPVYIHK